MPKTFDQYMAEYAPQFLRYVAEQVTYIPRYDVPKVISARIKRAEPDARQESNRHARRSARVMILSGATGGIESPREGDKIEFAPRVGQDPVEHRVIGIEKSTSAYHILEVTLG